MKQFELSMSLANCTSAKEFQKLMAGNNIYITDTKRLGNSKSKVSFAYHNGELKAFDVLVDDGVL